MKSSHHNHITLYNIDNSSFIYQPLWKYTMFFVITESVTSLFKKTNTCHIGCILRAFICHRLFFKQNKRQYFEE